MKFSEKYITNKLGMIYTILDFFFFSFLNWEGAVTQPQFKPRKFPE